MSHLLIDLGNSRIKWALEHEGRMQYGDGLHYHNGDWRRQLKTHFASMDPPADVYISSVVDAATEIMLQELIDSLWQCAVVFVQSPKLGNGVSNAYIDAPALGSDRWMAMIAAFHKAKAAVCVVDCGTAVTLDVIDHKGRHCGGLIVPGLGLMQQSLTHNTSAIASDADLASEFNDELGVDTLGGIRAGSVHAVCGMIERVVQKMNHNLKTSLQCYITGGDAPKVLPYLNLRSHFEPYLVLQGLALVARAA